MSNDGRPVRAPRRRLPARGARCRGAPRLRGAPGHLPTVPGGNEPVAAGSPLVWACSPLPSRRVTGTSLSPTAQTADLPSRRDETGPGESGKVAGVVDAMDGGKSAAVPLDLVDAGGAEIQPVKGAKG